MVVIIKTHMCNIREMTKKGYNIIEITKNRRIWKLIWITKTDMEENFRNYKWDMKRKKKELENR